MTANTSGTGENRMADSAVMNFTFKEDAKGDLTVDCEFDIPESLNITMDEILDAVAMTIVALHDEEHGVEGEVH